MIVWNTFADDFEKAYRSIPRQTPYVTLLKGGYQDQVTCAGGRRTFWLYYPSNMEYSYRNLTILLPNSLTAAEFLETSGWRELAEREDLFLFLVGGKEDPWQNYEREETLLDALDEARCDRKHIDAQKSLSYLIGYGEGADLAHRYVLKNPSKYASAAFMGTVSADAGYMAQTGALPSDAVDIPKREVPCPVSFTTAQSEHELTAVLEYWQSANCTESEPYQQNGAKIWMPDMAVLESVVEHQPVARVRYIQSETYIDTEETEEVWSKFLSRTVRPAAILNGDLHPYRTQEQWQVVRREIVVDGWVRHWYEYVAPRKDVLTNGSYPIVVFLHGGSSNGLMNLYSHEWVQVAKERGFIVAMPTGTMRLMSNDMPHPAWNASCDAEHMDDEKFLRMMLEDIESRQPVDKGRIYVTGHSMGSAMTQRVALCMPELFAAAMSNSGVVCGGFLGSFDLPGVREDYDIPIWIQMGENDIGGGTLGNNLNAKKTVEYWAARYGLNMEHPGNWRSGRYLNLEWRNDYGVPMLRYTTTLEKPHAVTPQDPWSCYDEFFSHFSRNKNGELLFCGQPINHKSSSGGKL